MRLSRAPHALIGSLSGLRLTGGSGAAPSPLLTGLIAYWKLDEASGPRIDSAGSNNLADANSVGSVTGVIGGAAGFVSTSSQSLSCPPLLGGATWSVSLWLKVASGGATRSIFGAYNDASQTSPFCFLDATNRVSLDQFPPSGGSFVSATPLLNDVWYHIVVVQANLTTRKLYINAGEEGTHSEGYTGSAPNIFRLGARGGASGALSSFQNGDIDEAGVWSRALTPAEITQLYNGGAGITYPF